MPWAFLAVTLVGAWFTFNAYLPRLRQGPFSVPSFFAGWLTSELPGHHFAWQLAATKRAQPDVSEAPTTAMLRGAKNSLSRSGVTSVRIRSASVAGIAISPPPGAPWEARDRARR